MNPYAAPIASSTATSDDAPRPKHRWPTQSLACFGVSIVAMAIAFAVVAIFDESTYVGVIAFGIAALIALAGVWRGISFGARHRSGLSLASGLLVVFVLLGNLMMTGVGMLLAFASTIQFTRGRQLRRRGRVLLPPVRAGAAWARSSMPMARALPAEEAGVPALDPATRGALAAQWRENGRTEHASVAAFARLTLDLMALGAPPSLLSAAQRDALDEIRHTERCFSLARALDGKVESPGPFPEAQRARTLIGPRTLALSQLAVDSLIDGALHEGVSARILARLAKRCEIPAVRAILKEIAADEGRHAAHGWDVVAWCVSEGGRPVIEALRGAMKGIPAAMASPLPAAAKDGAWERYGIHGHALEASEYEKCRADLESRVASVGALSQAA